ncbi:hypothetical protein NYO98_11740 [Nocardioides sp. STR2]|uniref:Capsular polysaccharide biosynthesis protein n=1 Tax=Nocardioides pini TaxID=2975053 RepID=A0ABT4CD99_9ACTN|nr:hypothetical protein [Nocardioides pini]MCY4726950.1 hypothetical protein [Nocardioides pini]
MTVTDLLVAAWRQRIVVCIGIVLTAVAGLLAIQDRSVFWTRAEVVFLPPQNEYYPNALRSSSESVIITAGAVAKRVLGPDRVPKYASPEVNLVGVGVREGWSISLPDTGGQWSYSFDSQVLAIEAVGPSREFVLETVAEVRHRVSNSLRAVQVAESVPPETRISLRASPGQPVVYGVGGNRPRALGMTAVLGGILTLCAALARDKRQARRKRTVGSVPADPASP